MEEKRKNTKLSLAEMIPMQEIKKPQVKELHEFLVCKICEGYLVDATTIVECLHTYCKSCIVAFLKLHDSCYICRKPVNKNKPVLNLRPDPTIQRLVYKSVPGLYKNELSRRKNSDMINGVHELQLDDNDEYYFDPQDLICLSLEYIENNSVNVVVGVNEKIKHTDGGEMEKANKITHKRYLQCPAAFKIQDMFKFIRLKYNLQSDHHKIEVFYDDVKLPGYFTLMDTAYTFKWNQKSPMRLFYHILEPAIIQVPVVIPHKITHQFVPEKSSKYVAYSSPSQSPSSETSSLSSPPHSHEDRQVNGGKNVNIKRKADSVTPDSLNACDNASGKKTEDELTSFREPSVKVPRLEIPSSKPNEVNVKVETDTRGSLVLDDFTDYEQDIEEVENDEEGDDRLRISPVSEMDQDDKQDDCEVLVIDTSDADTTDTVKEDSKDDRKSKYKRKNKKSRHHHHHKHHHHRHSKKNAPQATILHSPDTDIMKLKVKLNTVSSDIKHHKQSKRKRKRSPENAIFSSSSSVSSMTLLSPVTNRDEDSLHSHISEFSVESVETIMSKDDTSASSTPKSSIDGSSTKPKESESNASKEKLMQVRNFKSKGHVNSIKGDDNAILEIIPKNDDNNNDKLLLEEKPDVEVIRTNSSSAITVSKVTAAEVKKEQEKQLFVNGNKEDPPALEITVVPAKVPVTTPSPPICCSIPVAASNKANQKPVPAAIPLSQFHKMKSDEQALSKIVEQHNIPKSLSITAHKSSNPPRTLKMNPEIKKVKESPKMESIKQSVTISLTDDSNALDLSGKPSMAALSNFMANSIPRGLTHFPFPMPGFPYPQPDMFPRLGSASPIHQRNYNKASIPIYQNLKAQHPIRSNPAAAKYNLPPLNEIKTGPPSRPGPNQNVRNIPNISRYLIDRHQQQVGPNSPVACSFSNLQNGEKCPPPSLALNHMYLDRNSLMATK